MHSLHVEEKEGFKTHIPVTLSISSDNNIEASIS